jgi:hypothetical protein
VRERDFAADGLFRLDHLVDLALVHLRVPVLVADLPQRLPDGLFESSAPHLQHRVVGEREAVVEVEGVDEVGRAGDDRLVESLLLLGLGGHPSQLRLRFLALGDVGGSAAHSDRLAVAVVLDFAAGLHPQRIAVRVRDAVLGLELARLLDRLGESLPHPFSVSLVNRGDELLDGDVSSGRRRVHTVRFSQILVRGHDVSSNVPRPRADQPGGRGNFETGCRLAAFPVALARRLAVALLVRFAEWLVGFTEWLVRSPAVDDLVNDADGSLHRAVPFEQGSYLAANAVSFGSLYGELGSFA